MRILKRTEYSRFRQRADSEAPDTRRAALAGSRGNRASSVSSSVRPSDSPLAGLPPDSAPNASPSTELVFPGPRIRNITIPTLIPYFPAHPNGTAIIFCPGGAYVHEHMGSANHFARYFLGKNITVFILKYRLHGSQDVKQISLEDGKRAVQVVRSRAAEWHLNPQRIGLAGESAGANVALHVLSAFDTATTGTNDTNAMSSRPDFVVLLACWAGKEVVSPYPLPKDSPPVFLCHADDDMTAPAALSESIVQTLSSYGVPARLFTVPTGGHGAFFLGTNPPATAWPNTFLPWLENLKLLDNGSPLQPE